MGLELKASISPSLHPVLGTTGSTVGYYSDVVPMTFSNPNEVEPQDIRAFRHSSPTYLHSPRSGRSCRRSAATRRSRGAQAAGGERVARCTAAPERTLQVSA